MSHYSQDHEHSEKTVAVKKREGFKKVQKQLQKLMEATDLLPDYDFPERFSGAFEDFDNYLTVQIGNLK